MAGSPERMGQPLTTLYRYRIYQNCIHSYLSLLKATIVVADGSVLIASKDQNEDLFWGIRGGGSNFGVCTEFVYKLYDQRRTVYAGVLIFPQSKIKELSKTTMDWWTKGPSGKEGIIQAFTRSPPQENAVSQKSVTLASHNQPYFAAYRFHVCLLQWLRRRREKELQSLLRSK